MLTIKCSHCHRKLMKYEKIGEGRILRCWKSRIRRDFLIYRSNGVYCQCGRKIGSDEGKYIRMKQSAFIYRGTKQTSG